MRNATIAALVAIASLLGSTAAAEAQGIDTTCLLSLTRTDPVTVNVAYPDEAAVYWGGVYVAIPGTRLRIDGRFPHARYMSLNVYDPLIRPLDALADADIRPDAGSSNPFRDGARRDDDQRSYSVFVEFGPRPARPEDRAPNTLYAGTAQDGSANLVGTIVYRVYVPDRGRDETGGTGLPTVTLQTKDGGRAPRSLCADVAKPPPPLGLHELIAHSNLELPLSPRSIGREITWRKFTNFLVGLVGDNELTRALGGSGGFFSNVHNAYVYASVSREFGKVVETRMRVPSFADTRAGTKVMRSGDVRYFSMCQNEGLSTRVIACRPDDRTVVDKDGFATYVTSSPEQRPATATARCGVTWLPWGPFTKGVLIYRHLLPAPDFMQAIQRAELGKEAATMGDVLPVSRYHANAAAYDRASSCRASARRASRGRRTRR